MSGASHLQSLCRLRKTSYKWRAKGKERKEICSSFSTWFSGREATGRGWRKIAPASLKRNSNGWRNQETRKTNHQPLQFLFDDGVDHMSGHSFHLLWPRKDDRLVILSSNRHIAAQVLTVDPFLNLCCLVTRRYGLQHLSFRASNRY